MEAHTDMDHRPTDSGSQWHLDKRVPISLFVALALQFAAAAWWGSAIAGRLERAEDDVRVLRSYNERLIRLEAKMENQTILLQQIAAKIEADR